MQTQRLAQSTLLFTLVIALLPIFTISWMVLQAELAALREEVAALRKVFEERYQAQ